MKHSIASQKLRTTAKEQQQTFFTKWELLDLANFRVKLKAEFEGSNADMYRPEAVVGKGPKREP